MVDSLARTQLAELARALLAGAITTDQFEDRIPVSTDPAVEEIFAKGFWPLYSDTTEHYLTGENALDAGEDAFASRCILFLGTSLPYEWPVRSRSQMFWRGLLNLLTLGAFGRAAQRKLRTAAEIDAWPFRTMQQLADATQLPSGTGGQPN